MFFQSKMKKNLVRIGMLLTVITMITGNISILGMGINQVLAQQEEIDFNVYALSSEQKVQEIDLDNSQANAIYADVQVNRGYLKDAKIRMIDTQEGVINVSIQEISARNQTVSAFDSANKQIILNKINAGEKDTLTMKVGMDLKEERKLSLLSSTNTFVLEGIYVNENGKESNISKQATLKINWTGNTEVSLSQELSKVVDYEIEGKVNTVIANTITMKKADASLPIASMKLVFQLALPQGVKPSSVHVVCQKSDATTGKVRSFSASNYSYNANTNELTIQVTNAPDEKGQVWMGNQNGEDSYIITYAYENLDKQQNTTATVHTVAEVEFYRTENEKTTVTKEQMAEKDITGEISKLPVTSSYTIAENSLDKGYLYANMDKQQGKYETPFTVNQTMVVEYAKAAGEVIVESTSDILSQEDKIVAEQVSVMKQTLIHKQDFLTILGNDGTIAIKDQTGQVITTLTKDTAVNEAGYIEVNYEGGVSSVTMQTSAPIAEGNIEIIHHKALAADKAYTLNQLRQMNQLQVNGVVKTSLGEDHKQANIPLKETVTKAEISVNKNSLSTVRENQNVELKVILRTDSTQYDLYKNPTFEIVLPKAVEEISFNSANLAFTQELTLKETSTYKNKEGNIVIRVILENTQTQYNIGQVMEGPTVILNTNMTLAKLALTEDSQILLNYTNERAIAYENGESQGIATAPIRIVAPTEIITTNEIARGAESTASITESETGLFSASSDNRIATMKQKIVNNIGNAVEGIQILGRIPFKGNKEIDTGKDLGTTFDTKLVSKIIATGISNDKMAVYYSTNGEATSDRNDSANAWTKEPSDLASIKSYLIVLENYEMENGKEIEFSYNIELPEELGLDNNAYGTYKVLYSNKSNVAIMNEEKAAPYVGLTTGQSPKLEASISSSLEQNAKIREGQMVKMTATVKNTGTVTAQEVAIILPQIAGVEYVDYDEINGVFADNTTGKVSIGTIEVGKTVTKNYYIKAGTITPEMFCNMEDHYTTNAEGVKKHKTEQYELICTKPEHFTTLSDGTKIHIDDQEGYTGPDLYDDPSEYKIVNYTHKDSDYQAVLSTKIQVEAKDISNPVETNTYAFISQKGYMEIEHNVERPDYIYTKGSQYSYFTTITNMTNNTINNINATITLPTQVKAKEAYVWNLEGDTIQKDKNGITINDNNTVTVKAETLSKNNNIYVETVVEVQEAGSSIMSSVTATAENIPEHQSNIVVLNTQKIELSMEQKLPTKQYVKEKEEFTYQFIIKNNSNSKAFGVDFKDELPEGVQYLSTKYTVKKVAGGQEEISEHEKYDIDGRTVRLYRDMEIGEEVQITIRVRAKLLDGKEDKEIYNKATLEAAVFDKIESNTVKNVIEYSEEAHDPGEEGGGDDVNPTQKTYKVSGTAWVDSNKNGQREEQEELLAGVPVILLNKATSLIVTDTQTGQKKQTTTDAKGGYIFENIPKGEYLVIFLPDMNYYDVTDYRKTAVPEDFNSDAIAMTISLEGKEQKGAVSDTIRVTNGNIRNIDIGLVPAEKFDLKLDKYVDSITVTNSKGTKTNTYTDEKTAKVDLYRKDVVGSNVIIKYKFVVTNEGAVPGYAKKIVDYIPKGLKFSSELNKDWYASTDGNLYNASLANTKLNPGESKTITLTLTKTMTEDNVGIVSNSAEIYETYNEKGLQDTDSTPANKVQKEDDYSSADVFITVGTGKAVWYITLTTVSIAVLGVGIYMIKKKVLQK